MKKIKIQDFLFELKICICKVKKPYTAKLVPHQLHLYFMFPGPQLHHTQGGFRKPSLFRSCRDMFMCYSEGRTQKQNVSHYYGFSPILVHIPTQDSFTPSVLHCTIPKQITVFNNISSYHIHIKFFISYLFPARLK